MRRAVPHLTARLGAFARARNGFGTSGCSTGIGGSVAATNASAAC
jgi:hypothetical protein